MEYKLIRAKSEESLEKMVNQAMQEGWKPQGGVAGVWNGFLHAILWQAMVK